MRSMLGGCYTSAILCLQATVLNSVLKQTIIKERLDAVLHDVIYWMECTFSDQISGHVYLLFATL